MVMDETQVAAELVRLAKELAGGHEREAGASLLDDMERQTVNYHRMIVESVKAGQDTLEMVVRQILYENKHLVDVIHPGRAVQSLGLGTSPDNVEMAKKLLDRRRALVFLAKKMVGELNALSREAAKSYKG